MPIISGGSGSGGTPGDGTITNAMLATSPNNTVKANVSGGVASDTDLDIGLLPVGSRYRPAIAIIPYLFSTGVVDNDPTSGKFKFNTAITGDGIGAIDKMWIDPINTGLIDQTFDIKLAQAGDKFAVMNATLGTLYTVFTLSSAYTDKTGYFEYSGETTSGTLPTNNQSVMLVYVSKGTDTLLSIIGDLVHVSRDGGGLVNGLLDKDGNQLAGQRQAANYAALPASVATNPRETWRLLDSNLDYTNDGVNNYWYPQNKICTIFKNPSLISVVVPALTFGACTMSNNGGTMRLAGAGVHGLTNAVCLQTAPLPDRQIYISAWSGDGVPGFYPIADVDANTSRIDLTQAYSATAGNPTVALAGTGRIPIWTFTTHPFTPTTSLDWDITTENITTVGTAGRAIVIMFDGVDLLSINHVTAGNIINRCTGGINNMGDVAIQRTNYASANTSGSGTTTSGSARTTIATGSAKTFGLYYVLTDANQWFECTQMKVRMSVA